MDREDFNNFDEEEYNNKNEQPADEDFGKTQEMDSLRSSFKDEARGITPREEFTDMNSADDMSRTLLMDSVPGEDPIEPPIPADNPIKRRRHKKKKQTNHVRTMGQVFLGVVISVVAVCVGSLLAYHTVQTLRDFTGMAKDQKEFDLSITDDTTVDEVIDTLGEKGILLKPSLFKSYLKFTKNDGGFLVGTHTLRANMSYGNIVTALNTPKAYTQTIVKIMFPEGSTAMDVGELLEKNHVCRAEDFEKVYRTRLEKPAFIKDIPDGPNRLNLLEGYLWPDTYEFYVIDDWDKYPTLDTSEYALTAAKTMLNTFNSKITKKMKNRMEELDMTLDEVIILASLIQREGNAPENMAIISSVFHNRMNNTAVYPKLESNTTYTYIDQCIKPCFTAEESDKMQRIINAYDTYECYGLPAGAICNPGMDAITAALYPDETEYYYFLSDKEGVFHYAKTLPEHEQNIIDAGLNTD